MTKFVKVYNNYTGELTILTPKELYVLTYLKYEIKGNESLIFNMKMFFEVVKDSSTYIEYSKNKKSKVSTLDNRRTLVPVLDSLIDIGILKCDKRFSEIKIGDNVKISINEEEDPNGFEPISQLFIEELFKEVGVVGFYVYAYLKKICYSDSKIARKSLVIIAKEVGLSDKTVYLYIELLQELGLIKVESVQKENRKRVGAGKKPYANNYYVPSKTDIEDRYYCDFSKP